VQEEEEEAVENDVDFNLMRGCKKEIKVKTSHARYRAGT
jgi:hypothetical protein